MKLLAAALAAAAFVACSPFPQPRVPVEEPRTVPDVVGQTVAEAVELLEGEELGAVVDDGGADYRAPGGCDSARVVSQDPPPRQHALRDSSVVLVVRSCSGADPGS